MKLLWSGFPAAKLNNASLFRGCHLFSQALADAQEFQPGRQGSPIRHIQLFRPVKRRQPRPGRAHQVSSLSCARFLTCCRFCFKVQPPSFFFFFLLCTNKVSGKKKPTNNLLSNYCEGQFIKQPLQISKVFLRLHQHMFYIFYLA